MLIFVILWYIINKGIHVVGGGAANKNVSKIVNKFYKMQCCRKKDVMNEYDLIKKVTVQEGYEPMASDFICKLYHYMREKH